MSDSKPRPRAFRLDDGKVVLAEADAQDNANSSRIVVDEVPDPFAEDAESAVTERRGHCRDGAKKWHCRTKRNELERAVLVGNRRIGVVVARHLDRRSRPIFIRTRACARLGRRAPRNPCHVGTRDPCRARIRSRAAAAPYRQAPYRIRRRSCARRPRCGPQARHVICRGSTRSDPGRHARAPNCEPSSAKSSTDAI